MSRRAIRWIVVAGGIAGAGYAAALHYAAPVLEQQLTGFLHQKGFKNVALRLAHFGVSGAQFEDITVGAERALTVKKLGVGYSLSGLRQETIRQLAVEGVAVHVLQQEQGWVVQGLEPLMAAKGDDGGAFALPMTREALGALPLSELTITDSTVNVSGATLQATVPVTLEWNSAATAVLRYSADAIEASSGKMMLHTGAVQLSAAPAADAAEWKGDFTIQEAMIEGAPLVLPALNVKGTVTFSDTELRVDATLSDAGKQYQAAVRYVQALNGAPRSHVEIANAVLPWNGGALRIHKAMIPLMPKADTELLLAADNISVTALLDAFTKEHAKGTGKISGVVPVTIRKNGEIIVHQGKLEASEPGTLSISPETIPGDNAQLGQVRDILKNLHYTTLSMTANSDKGNAVTLQLTVEGKNPELPDSRPVRLNVHLSGDVLDLIQQNVMAITDPNQLLEKHVD